jgi:hypothetical protein
MLDESLRRALLSVNSTRDRTSLSLDTSSSTYQVPHHQYFSDPCYRGECSTQYYRDQDSTRTGLILRLSRSGIRIDSCSKCLKTRLKTHLSKRTRYLLNPHGRSAKGSVSVVSLREAIALQPEETTPAPTCTEPSSLLTTRGVPIIIAASQ